MSILSISVHAFAILFLASPMTAAAAADPAVKCAVSKHKASAKKLSAMLKCYDSAYSKGGTTADPECLAKAQTKFDEAFAKADTAGGCRAAGDAGSIGGIVNGAVTDLLDAEPGAPATPEDCNNNTDDDFDGYTDCHDQDCSAEPKCTDSGGGESGNIECQDGVNNDADFFTDCDDFQCQPYTSCGGWNPAD